jgi:hypothetical protein
MIAVHLGNEEMLVDTVKETVVCDCGTEFILVAHVDRQEMKLTCPACKQVLGAG